MPPCPKCQLQVYVEQTSPSGLRCTMCGHSWRDDRPAPVPVPKLDRLEERLTVRPREWGLVGVAAGCVALALLVGWDAPRGSGLERAALGLMWFTAGWAAGGQYMHRPTGSG